MCAYLYAAARVALSCCLRVLRRCVSSCFCVGFKFRAAIREGCVLFCVSERIQYVECFNFQIFFLSQNSTGNHNLPAPVCICSTDDTLGYSVRTNSSWYRGGSSNAAMTHPTAVAISSMPAFFPGTLARAVDIPLQGEKLRFGVYARAQQIQPLRQGTSSEDVLSRTSGHHEHRNHASCRAATLGYVVNTHGIIWTAVTNTDIPFPPETRASSAICQERDDASTALNRPLSSTPPACVIFRARKGSEHRPLSEPTLDTSHKKTTRREL